MMERILNARPSAKARLAGGLYFFNLLAAAVLELVFPDKMNFTAGIIEIVGMAAVTLVLYDLFRPVNRSLSILAAAFNFVGIILEAMKLNSHGTDIAMVFHAVFCFLIGYLIFRSAFVPRVLGALIAFGGLGWLTFLSAELAANLSPYNLAIGLGGEASVFLWLLAMGVNVLPWQIRSAETAAPARS